MIQDSDLQDGQRIFMLQEGKFWPAKLNTTQLPDVYSIILEKQRGNRPIILPRDDILNEAVSFIGFKSFPCSSLLEHFSVDSSLTKLQM